ncbi:hypothetical protein [Paraburkholderia saeva]|uniref:Uncharacterized protein n=1 Tax=Paraburkholderia saeva TaxID=2777537 RepID=A0A9N8X3M2_9BURK|nr:hypothetical protein [Paraburkholderia saeva]CAG4889237.1 hypothetical protein R70241_00695 [Paraburkholderia saeva]CAG4903944.1 hypothetical protein R52603_03147 [Paraburkholderia saeva]CAG4914872.1 hypothetical protein LMG31841_04419 [Paraburkholderia saeva]
MNWNRLFTDLIRNGRPAYWGNWTLSPKLKPGAVGIIAPDSGEFTLVREETPGQVIGTRDVPNQWKLSSANVHRTEAKVELDGSGTDPDTGTKVTAGVEVKWEFSVMGSMASEFGIASEAYISDLTVLTRPETLKWLAEQAESVSMGSGGSIAQGFGVVTSAIYAHSGLNVGSQDNSSSFSMTGSASAVHEMLGGANGKGSFLSVNQNKSVDQHMWPYKAEALAASPIPIAYTVASFDGKLLIPNWITRLGAFEILFSNKPGCTYVTHIQLSYDTPQGRRNDEFSLTGGISKTAGNIPLSATNIHVDVKFQGVVNSDHYTFNWPSPLGQWLTGRREIEMTGVWPGQTHAAEH